MQVEFLMIKLEDLRVLRIRVRDIAFQKTTFLNVKITFLHDGHYFSFC